MSYKWETPAAWLEEQLGTAARDGAVNRLYNFAIDLMGKLDSDQLQELFQAEMAADGYFDERPTYHVVVGNIGTVYSGPDEAEALKRFNSYMEQSISGTGRAGNEDVTLFCGDEIEREFTKDRPWIIRNTDANLYWNAADGWSSRDQAEHYSDQDRHSLDLPIGGAWLREDGGR